MKQSVPIITRKTLISGNFTRNSGTVPRLSLTISHMNNEATVRTIAWAVIKSSPAVLLVTKSE